MVPLCHRDRSISSIGRRSIVQFDDIESLDPTRHVTTMAYPSWIGGVFDDYPTEVESSIDCATIFYVHAFSILYRGPVDSKSRSRGPSTYRVGFRGTRGRSTMVAFLYSLW